MIRNNVIYLTIADKSYPRKLAFSYLDELAKEFEQSYGAKVDSVRKPYAFVGFGMHFCSYDVVCMALTYGLQIHSCPRLHVYTKTPGQQTQRAHIWRN